MKLRHIDWSKPYLKPTIVGFAAIYMLCLLLSTYLVKVKYEEEYSQALWNADQTIKESLEEMEPEIAEQSREETAYFANYLDMIVSDGLEMDNYNQISAAVYNCYGKKLLKLRW